MARKCAIVNLVEPLCGVIPYAIHTDIQETMHYTVVLKCANSIFLTALSR